MDRAVTALVGGFAVAVVASAGLVFTTTLEEKVTDDVRDLRIVESDRRPSLRSIADIRRARVTRKGSTYTFEAEMVMPIPESLVGGFYDVEWEIDGDSDWKVSAALATTLEGTLVSAATGAGSSTTLGDFPGGLLITGNVVTIQVDASKLADFPDRFRWKLSTSLNMQGEDPRSALIYDFAPDGRYANFRL